MVAANKYLLIPNKGKVTEVHTSPNATLSPPVAIFSPKNMDNNVPFFKDEE